MKTPSVDDQKPKRDKLGPTGPVEVSGDPKGSKETGAKPSADGSYEQDLENILDRKRAQTPPG